MSDAPTKLKLDDAAGKRLFQQLHDVWLGPEIDRRRSIGAIDDSYRIHLAQVVMHVGVSPVVRLNDEVRGDMLVRMTRDLQVGEAVHVGHYDDVAEVRLPEEDANAAHITLVRTASAWAIHVSARYNTQRIQETRAAAGEFIAVAESALQNGHRRAFLELLFGACELTAKAWLLRLPDLRFIERVSHKLIASQVDADQARGQLDPDFAAAYHRLRALRDPSRYLNGTLSITDEDMRKDLAIVKAKLDHVHRAFPSASSTTPPAILEDAEVGEGVSTRSSEPAADRRGRHGE